MSASIKNIQAEIREDIVWEKLAQLSQGARDRPCYVSPKCWILPYIFHLLAMIKMSPGEFNLKMFFTLINWFSHLKWKSFSTIMNNNKTNKVKSKITAIKSDQCIPLLCQVLVISLTITANMWRRYYYPCFALCGNGGSWKLRNFATVTQVGKVRTRIRTPIYRFSKLNF